MSALCWPVYDDSQIHVDTKKVQKENEMIIRKKKEEKGRGNKSGTGKKKKTKTLSCVTQFLIMSFGVGVFFFVCVTHDGAVLQEAEYGDGGRGAAGGHRKPSVRPDGRWGIER